MRLELISDFCYRENFYSISYKHVRVLMSVGSSYWDWTWTHGTSSVIPSRGSTSLQVSDSLSSCSLREREKDVIIVKIDRR